MNKYTTEFGATIMELQSLNYSQLNFVNSPIFANFEAKHSKYLNEKNREIQRLFNDALGGDESALSKCIKEILLLNEAQKMFDKYSEDIINGFTQSKISARKKMLDVWSAHIAPNLFFKLKQKFLYNMLCISAFDDAKEYIGIAFNITSAIAHWFLYLINNLFRDIEEAVESGAVLTDDAEGGKAYSLIKIEQDYSLLQTIETVYNRQLKIKTAADEALIIAIKSAEEAEIAAIETAENAAQIKNTKKKIESFLLNANTARINKNISEVTKAQNEAKTANSATSNIIKSAKSNLDKVITAIGVIAEKRDTIKRNKTTDLFFVSVELKAQRAFNDAQASYNTANKYISGIKNLLSKIESLVSETKSVIEEYEQERREKQRAVTKNYDNLRRLFFLSIIVGGFILLLTLTCSLWSTKKLLGLNFPFSGMGRTTLALAIISVVLVFLGIAFLMLWKKTKGFLWFYDRGVFDNISENVPYLKKEKLYDKTPLFVSRMSESKIHTVTKVTALIILFVSASIFFTIIGAIATKTIKYDGYDQSGWYYTQRNDEITLIKYLGKDENVIVPKMIKDMPIVAIEGAFKNSSVRSVVVNDNIRYIAQDSFKGCNSIEKLSLPFIGTGADKNDLYSLFGKDKAAIPSSLKHLIFIEGMTRVEPYAFLGLSNLVSVTLPQSITYVGKGAFADCIGLQQLQLPFIGESLTAIGKQSVLGYIFGNDVYTGIETTLQYSVDKYGVVSSEYYSIPSSLKEITVLGGEIKSGAFFNCSKLQKIILANDVLTIGNHAFNGCIGLQNLTFSANIEYVGSNAFINSPINNLIENTQGLIYIGKVLYRYGGIMPTNTTLTINDGTTQIFDFAFYNCSGLVGISLPASIKEIGFNAFLGVSKEMVANYDGTIEQWNNIKIAIGNNPLR